jgi:CheY-like chemotaxis protein
VGGPDEALDLLASDPSIVLVLSDIRMPDAQDGLEFIRTVRHRWPLLPLAAVTGFPEDLSELHLTAECPALVLLKPVRSRQLREALDFISRTLPASLNSARSVRPFS